MEYSDSQSRSYRRCLFCQHWVQCPNSWCWCCKLTILYSNNFCHVAAATANSNVCWLSCLFSLFHRVYMYVYAHAAQLQIAWNSNFNHLRLDAIFLYCHWLCLYKNWSPTTNCKTWCLYYYKINFALCEWIITYTHRATKYREYTSSALALHIYMVLLNYRTQLTYGRMGQSKQMEFRGSYIHVHYICHAAVAATTAGATTI